MKSAILLLALLPVAFATLGFDADQAISTSQFTCLKGEGYQFFIGRIWRSSGAYDFTGMQNIRNAHAAGISYIDGYIFPCLRSGCAHAANQVEATINKLSETGTKIGTLWLDVETYAWPANHASNRQFILDMANQAHSMGVRVGIYSNNNNWEQIVGLDWTGVHQYDLWWANYGGHQNFNGFVPFGGWSKPAIRQYAGDKGGPCGVTDYDLNWYP